MKNKSVSGEITPLIKCSPKWEYNAYKLQSLYDSRDIKMVAKNI